MLQRDAVAVIVSLEDTATVQTWADTDAVLNVRAHAMILQTKRQDAVAVIADVAIVSGKNLGGAHQLQNVHHVGYQILPLLVQLVSPQQP